MIKLTAKHYNAVSVRNRAEFPKHVKPILNYVCQTAQATRAKVVGSMKEMFQEFLHAGGRTLQEWEQYYNERGGLAKIEQATDRAWNLLQNAPIDTDVITRDVVKLYIEEIVYNKTHFGMSGEYHAVLAAGYYYDLHVRFSTAEEEKQGIDAWIGEHPVQVKPADSVKKHHVYNHADTKTTLVITYEKEKCYIVNPEFMENN